MNRKVPRGGANCVCAHYVLTVMQAESNATQNFLLFKLASRNLRKVWLEAAVPKAFVTPTGKVTGLGA